MSIEQPRKLIIIDGMDFNEREINFMAKGFCPKCGAGKFDAGECRSGRCNYFMTQGLVNYFREQEREKKDLISQGRPKKVIKEKIDPLHLKRLKRHACPYCGASHVKVGDRCWGCKEIVDLGQFRDFLEKKKRFLKAA